MRMQHLYTWIVVGKRAGRDSSFPIWIIHVVQANSDWGSNLRCICGVPSLCFVEEKLELEFSSLFLPLRGFI